MSYPTDIHGPSDSAPVQTNLVAHCQVCHTQWQVRSPNKDDARGCAFCGAPEAAIVLVSEHPDFSGDVVG